MTEQTWQRGVTRRKFLKVAGFTLAAACAPQTGTTTTTEAPGTTEAAATTAPPTTAEAGEVTVGAILDQTGPINIYGLPKVDAVNLAIKDINDNGGVLGNRLRLIMYDAQSTNELYTQYANQLALQDGAVVVQGGITSASREAIRPVLRDHGVLYFYNEQYEGGVCDRNTFCTGVVPSQQLEALIPWTIENVGPRLVVYAADYNYGQISALWVDRIAQENGGEVLASEFIPLEVAEFGPTISQLQSLQPDAVVSLLVGGNHISFYRAFAAAGLRDAITVVSPTFGLGNEQVVLAPEEGEGIVVAYPYFQELDSPINQEFVEMWHAEYGADYDYIPDAALDEWIGWHMWADAVEQAGTFEREAVIEALESGVSFEGPGGLVTMSGPAHHLTKDTHIAVTNTSHGFDVIESFEQVPPAFELENCDLIVNSDTNTQFTPDA